MGVPYVDTYYHKILLGRCSRYLSFDDGKSYLESVSIKLEGVVEDVVYYNQSNGYNVLLLSTSTDDVTVVGDLGRVEVGETLIVEGEYTTHAKFGVQFKATYCERKLPTDKFNIERYISNIKGVGDVTAKRIVDTFGEDTFRILQEEPERLIGIKGITRKKAKSISDGLKNIFAIKNVSAYFSHFGISNAVSMLVFKLWGSMALQKVMDNPYILCREDIGVSFEKAEAVAKDCKLEPTSPKRIVAGGNYILSLANFDGNTCMPINEFLNRLSEKLSLTKSEVQKVILNAIDSNLFVLYSSNDGKEYIYTTEYYSAQKYIAEKLVRMVRLNPNHNMDFTSIIEKKEAQDDIHYNAMQRKAINLALNDNVMVLTGGPGTGKTTTLNGIISIFKDRGLKVKVTAPTGRASKRISDITGYEATTIHRLLEVAFDEYGSTYFVHDDDNPLKCDVVVVDEVSMVDTVLFKSLLMAISLSCKLILVGDSNQLPSVSAGNVLKDIIDSNIVDVVELTEIFRQAQESDIVMNAHNILNGRYPTILKKDKDFFFFQRLNYSVAQSTVIDLWKNRLPKAYNYSPIEDIQVLSPSRKGALGVINLNKAMQEVVNPHLNGDREVKNSIYTFRVGDKVMQIKNNYDIRWTKDGRSGLGIYNGDMGIIEKITSDGLTIDFDGRIVQYDLDTTEQLELAYAVTIHKSQGSEFDVVIIPVLNTFKKLSYRSLLYTAITRAKKLLIIVGSQKELFAMVDNNRTFIRYTNQKDMIIDVYEQLQLEQE